MSIKIEITAGSIPEMADKLVALAASFSGGTALATGTVAVGEPVTAGKPNRSRKPVETAATSAATGAGSETPAPEQSDPVEPAAQTSSDPVAPSEPAALDFDNDVAPVVIRAVTTKGKPFVEEVLGTFGVTKASQLDEARYPELISTLNDAMAA